MLYSEIGLFADTQLKTVAKFNPNISIPLYVVMPNHIHAIVCINADPISVLSKGDRFERAPNPALRACETCQRHVPTLSRYVSSLKGAITKKAKSLGIEFGWQSRYHDHYIRNSRDANNISNYILNNIVNWDTDCFNSLSSIK